MIVTGHRDTHFRFLKDVRLNVQYELTGTDGMTLRYRATKQRVMDSRRDVIPIEGDKEELLLVTCFPFDAIKAGGPLRYVVWAERVN